MVIFGHRYMKSLTAIPVTFGLFTSCHSGFFSATNPGEEERICEIKLKAFLSVCQGCLGGERPKEAWPLNLKRTHFLLHVARPCESVAVYFQDMSSKEGGASTSWSTQ